MSEQNSIEDIQFNGDNIYKEETFTDLEVGTIRKLTPIKADGSEDPDRKASFSATTNIMTPSGALPSMVRLKPKPSRKRLPDFQMPSIKPYKNSKKT